VTADSAPTEAAGQSAGLQAMPASRRGVLVRLKSRGEATAETLAGDLGVTVGAVRQLLAALASDGLVAHRDERSGVGRPRRWWCLAPAAEALFPKRYGQLTNQLLEFLEGKDPALVSEAFRQRGQERRRRAEARLSGLTLAGRVAELARILDEDGYLAEWEETSPGRWRIVERNCAVLDVATLHREACSSELDFIRAVLPGAEVRRVSHIVAGGHACAYEIATL
jgi:DeoR family suf operon transcriptional repressor